MRIPPPKKRTSNSNPIYSDTPQPMTAILIFRHQLSSDTISNPLAWIATINNRYAPQAMTAALIFRRQLVRPRALKLQQALQQTSCHSKNFIRCLT
jgi:hypothetical protein